MLLRLAIYWIGFVGISLLYAINRITEGEYKYVGYEPISKKYRNTMRKISEVSDKLFTIGMVIYFLYNIYILTLGYNMIIRIACIGYIVFFCFAILIFTIYYDKRWKYFNSIKDITYGIFSILSVIGLIVYLAMMFFFMSDGMHLKGKESDKYEKYAYSIDILRMREVPYTNTYGWYVRSDPSSAYYYDVVNEHNNIITQVIDGQEYYVERDENNKYISNPHIEVYYTIQKYYNIYTMKEFEDVTDIRYVICIPENSIYYEN